MMAEVVVNGLVTNGSGRSSVARGPHVVGCSLQAIAALMAGLIWKNFQAVEGRSCASL